MDLATVYLTTQYKPFRKRSLSQKLAVGFELLRLYDDDDWDIIVEVCEAFSTAGGLVLVIKNAIEPMAAPDWQIWGHIKNLFL